MNRIDRDRYGRVKEVFQQALERQRQDRRRFLDRACGGDADLRREVESLLRYHVGADRPEEPATEDEEGEDDPVEPD